MKGPIRAGLRSSARDVVRVAISLALLSAALASTALAQSDVQIAPDGVRVLISKDLGGERWAITVDPALATVNGATSGRWR